MAGRRERQNQMARQAFQARTEATQEAEQAKRDDSPKAAPETPQTKKPAAKQQPPAKPAAESKAPPKAETKERKFKLPFGRAKEEEASKQAEGPIDPARTPGKGRPTPKRKDVEAANRRPLVVTDRRAARVAKQEARDAAFKRRQEGINRGDERYFLPRDRGRARAYARDIIDARWNAGELMLPVAVVVLLVMLLQRAIPDVVYIVILVTYFVLLAALVDSVLAGFLTLRKVKKKFDADEIPRWTGVYAGMRAMQLRRLRQPKPRVSRGEKLD